MLILQNEYLKVAVNQTKGGAITSIFSKRTKDEWIYYDSSLKSKEKSSLMYDDLWCGGFEELFPNDAPNNVNGRVLKDHGELWMQSWQIIHRDQYFVNLQTNCKTVPAVVSKNIRLHPTQPTIVIDYKIENPSNEEYPYLFKLHPAMRIEQGDELLLNGGTVIPVDLTFSKIIDKDCEFNWPIVIDKNGNRNNLSIIPDKNKKLQEFIYVKNLSSQWCGLKRKATNEEFIINFPGKILPYCWFFMALGGWRGHYTVVMEPCTNFPKDMIAAINNGTSAFMKPLEKLEFEISVNIRARNAGE